MRLFICTLLVISTFLYMIMLRAADDNYSYQFNSENQQTQFSRLTRELRCLVCQNETLADSNAPLAKDLRKKIALQIIAGSSDQEILNFLIKRYGDFILYKPRLISTTYLLWFSPALFLLIGIIMWWRISRARKIIRNESFTAIEQQRLKYFLSNTTEK